MTETKLRPICYPCKEDKDTTIHALVADYLDETLSAQDNVMNAVYDDCVKHGEDKED